MAINRQRLIFWILTPVVIVAAALPLWLVEVWTITRVGVAVGWVTLCGLLLVTLRDVVRFRWAARSLTGLVFTVYAVFFGRALFASTPGVSANAVVGFLIIGLPCLWYTVLGRWAMARAEQWTDGKGKDDRDSQNV